MSQLRAALLVAIAGVSGFGTMAAPAFIYGVRSPSIRAECSSVQPGMTKPEVWKKIHRIEPLVEILSRGEGNENVYTFRRIENLDCQIVFDSESNAVRTVKVVGE
jgi:hypothetical protein